MNDRRTPSTVVVLVIALCSTTGCRTARTTHTHEVFMAGTPSRWEQWAKRIEERKEQLLERSTRILTVDYDQNKLSNVLNHLELETDLAFEINWAALEAAGVEKDLLISLKLKEVPAIQVISLVMKVANAASLEPIGYRLRYSRDERPAEGGYGVIQSLRDRPTVIISTQRDLARLAYTARYDVQDLLEWGGEPESPYCLSAVTGQATIASMQTKPFTLARPTYEERVLMLFELIQDTIGEPAQWAPYGGELASLRMEGGRLVVRAPYDDHDELDRLFDRLRRSRQASLASLMRHEEVMALLKRADAFRMEQHYDEALKLVHQALRVDSQHAVAIALRDVLSDTMQRK